MSPSSPIRPIPLLLGPALGALGGGAAILAGLPLAAAITTGLMLWCALWWISEAFEAPVTALVPLALLPLFGVPSPAQIAAAVGHEAILLLAGGFMLSRALVAVGLHRRFALAIIAAIGTTSPRRLVLAFASSAGLISMWVSNTATALMLMPIALALLERHPSRAAVAVPVLLAIAYGASIGGLGTPIGTPPNLIFLGVYREASGREIGFLEWMGFGLPLLALFLPLVALWLARGLPRRCAQAEGVTPPPPWSAAEKRVLAVFLATVALWITRTEPAGGWSALLGVAGANDATVAMLAVLVLLVLPDGRGGRVLSWQQAAEIPWGILVLFAGGLALASAFSASGLGAILAARLGALAELPPLAIVLLVTAAMIFLTEITSNTAAAALAMPVLAAAAQGSGVDPALFMLPAALAASCAFMLPVATAPNAVVYGSGLVPARRMAREGFALNLAGIVLLTLAGYLRLL
jgi:sodium-dependent dicarboxylate transporter 2/3/5